jgi:hypothetical protein
MKKLLFVIAIVFVSLTSKAQKFTMTASGDTVTNTATKACSLKVVNSYKQVIVQAVITKISGTVGGTLTLQGSVDGVNFVTVDSALFVADGQALPTYTATNTAGAQSKIWIMSTTPYLFYKLSYTGTGTMSATLKGYILARN